MRHLLLPLALLLLNACGPGSEDLCDQFFEPYPDHITGRALDKYNGPYLEAMQAYSAGDHAAAKESLMRYMEQKGFDKGAHMYLACSLLALEEPYEAELQLDHLEKAGALQFRDQTEWYTVVCHLCSGQLDRALTGALRIADGGPHTYSAEATELAQALSGK